MTEQKQPVKSKKSLFSRLIFFVNLFAAVSLLLSHIASFISPAKIWWLAMFGIGFGISVTANLAFLIYWIIKRDRRLLLSLIALLLTADKLLGIYQIRFPQTEQPTGAMKVMSYNVRLFDLYNWTHNNESKEKIFEMLQEQNADIICFQEFYSSEDTTYYRFNNVKKLRSVLRASYSHIYYSITLRKTDHWGIATYSRYPIINKKTVYYTDRKKRAFIYSDIVKGKDTIRVMNMHLESIGFKETDYKYVESLKEEYDEAELKGALNILRRLKRAFVRRSIQAEAVQNEIRNSPYPVILCGDFNDTPSSYTYRTISQEMSDAFREGGSGSGRTYVGAFPSFRIDYILHSPSLRSTGYTTIQKKLSDHYPVSCYISK